MQLEAQLPPPAVNYEIPANRMFEIAESCAVGCEKVPHDDDCTKHEADQAIDDIMLGRLLKTANTMAGAAGINNLLDQSYILDIDLDYFRTKESLRPAAIGLFYEIIRRSIAITIATEPSYVRSLRIDKDLTSEYSLELMMEHIEKALT